MIIEFRHDGDFAAMQAAEAWCAAHDISVGAAQDHWPRGLFIGSASIAKWRNLSPADRESLHGVMFGSLRHGPVRVVLRDQLPAVQHLLDRIAAQPVASGINGLDGGLPGQSDGRLPPDTRPSAPPQYATAGRVRWPVRRQLCTHATREASTSTPNSGNR